MGWFPDTLGVEQPEVHTKENEIIEIVRDDVACSCVSFVRQYRHDIPSKDADQFQATTTEPTTGAVALMYYSQHHKHCGLLA